MAVTLGVLALLLATSDNLRADVITVPGTADPWLAGMPDGSTASLGDVAPAQSPVLVPDLSLVPGNFLTFTVSGGVSYDPSVPITSPDGVIVDHHHSGAENGLSDVTAPANALMGVFLSSLQPNLSLAPAALDFRTSASRDYATLSPLLQQVFFIGDGLTSGGVRQQIQVPIGATRLFLGSMDGEGWYNNIGSFSVTVVPEPITAQTYDAASDFSASNNPNGVWIYGWSQTLGGAFILDTARDNRFGIDLWLGGQSPDGNPSVSHNGTASAITFSSVMFQPGQLGFHPGPNGQNGMVRFTAPVAGSYSLEAAFTGLDLVGPTTTDVHIFVHGGSIFDGIVNGFGPGSGPSFSTVLTLAAGDTVDFSVGFGQNGNYFFDTTGLAAQIVAVPEPPACVPAPSGLIGWWAAEGNANDIEQANPGILSNGTTFTAGEIGQAFSFDGEDDFVQATTAGFPTGNSDRAIEFWVRVDEFLSVEEAFFVGYGDFGAFSQTYQVGTSHGQLYFSQWGEAIFGPVLQTNKWYHVAVSSIGNSVTLYLNGSVVATGTLDIDTPAGTAMYFGRIPGELGEVRRLRGAIDEVAIYNRALSSAEIEAIFIAGREGKCKGAAQQVSDLIGSVLGLGLSSGTANSLIVKLQASTNSLGRGNDQAACGSLGAFLNEVTAQKGKWLNDAQADALIAEATRIRAVLGCK